MIEGMIIKINRKKRLYLGYTPTPDILMNYNIDPASIKFLEVDEVCSMFTHNLPK